MIELSAVSYAYPGQPSTALREVSLTVRQGETLCVIGRNASGKSTLCRIAAGILKAGAGFVRIDGLPAGEEGTRLEIRRRVGFLQQDPESQFVSVTVEREIASGPENLGLSVAETRTIVEELLSFFGLTELRKRPPHALSGGQMQKVLLASLLAMRPKHLILDEPTSYLDPLERICVAKELKRVSDVTGTSVVWVTQFLREALASPRVIAIERGGVCFDGSPSQFVGRRDVHATLGIRNLERFLPSASPPPWVDSSRVRATPPVPGDVDAQ
ncbi:MAG: ATP-binding cassette domain-containing protein [Candidatus Eisenbacteria bacterium]|nr:ATP-binding cassette domain-containing protein [Candidatus Eisenbacteria bacterium]